MNWHPTLDDIERRPDRPWHRSRRDGGTRAEGTGPLDFPLGGSGCWCGKPYGHTWEGKDAGAAHPRDEGGKP